MSSPTSLAVPRIFVSHSHKDNEFGVRLVAALRSALGVDDEHVWFDISGGAHGGDLLWQKVVTEITARPIFIVVVSPDAMASPWVNNEITLAWTLKTTRPNRHIIPVLYRECEMRADLQMLLYISFLPPQPFETGLASLVTAIHALAGTHLAAFPDSVGTSDGRSPVSPPQSTSPADPRAVLVARLLPGIHEAAVRRDWSLVNDKGDYLLGEVPTASVPTEIYRLLGTARFELGDMAGARQVLDAALSREGTDTDLLALAARVCLRLNDPGTAATHLKRALALVDEPATRLDLLRSYAEALLRLKQWSELDRRAAEALRLAPDDPDWLDLRLRALQEQGQDGEALTLLRAMTARPDAPARWWLARARLARAVTNDDAEVHTALDTATRLAVPNDPAIAAGRRELFPPPAPPIAPEHFPQRLASLGFVPRKGKDPQTGKEVACIVPPTAPVPAGQFQMGKTNPRDPEGQYDGPERTATTEAFQIARYPSPSPNTPASCVPVSRRHRVGRTS